MLKLFRRPRRGQDGGARGVCIECGQPRRSYYLRCDACAQTIWQRLLQHPADQPTQPLPAMPAALPRRPQVSQDDQVDQVDRAYLASLPDGANETPDDAPFEATPLAAYPPLPPLGTARPGEFGGLMAQVRGAAETLPAIREDWNGCCPWCAREMRELSDDRYTHRPRRATITTCERHRKGLLALSADLRDGGYRMRFPASEGWAQG